MPGRTTWLLGRRRVAAPGPAARARSNRLLPLRLVELERTGDRVQHVLGRAPDAAALELRVVLLRDPGQLGDLAATKARDPAAPTERGETDLVRRDPGPPRDQEVTHLAAVLHGHHGTSPRTVE